jgi:transposase
MSTKPAAAHRTVNVGEVLNAIVYVLSTGCQWNALPSDLPPRSTTWHYLDLWDWDGTIERIHEALYVQSRESAGREPSPTTAIIDAQSAKGAVEGGVRLIPAVMMRARKFSGASGTSLSTRLDCS